MDGPLRKKLTATNTPNYIQTNATVQPKTASPLGYRCRPAPASTFQSPGGPCLPVPNVRAMALSSARPPPRRPPKPNTGGPDFRQGQAAKHMKIIHLRLIPKRRRSSRPVANHAGGRRKAYGTAPSRPDFKTEWTSTDLRRFLHGLLRQNLRPNSAEIPALRDHEQGPGPRASRPYKKRPGELPAHRPDRPRRYVLFRGQDVPDVGPVGLLPTILAVPTPKTLLAEGAQSQLVPTLPPTAWATPPNRRDPTLGASARVRVPSSRT